MQRLFPKDVSPIGRIFVLVAWLEAITWTGLLIGMVLKYGTDTTERGVQLFGPIHGVAFIAYAVATIVAAVTLRWKFSVALIALLAAVPPLATIAAEYWISKKRLAWRTHRHRNRQRLTPTLVQQENRRLLAGGFAFLGSSGPQPRRGFAL